MNVSGVRTFGANTFVAGGVPEAEAVEARIGRAIGDQLIAVRTHESLHALVTVDARELWLALIAVFAHEVALAQTKEVVVAEIDATNAVVGTLDIGARIAFLARVPVEVLRAVALEIGGRLEDARAVVEARLGGTDVVCFARGARVAGRTLAGVVHFARVSGARAAILALLRLVQTAQRVHGHVDGSVAVDAIPEARTRAHIAVERVGTGAAVEARIGEAVVALLAERARVLRIRAAANVAARNSFVVHQRDAHARVETGR